MDWLGAILIIRARSVIALMAIVGQLVSTFGMPLPIAPPSKDASIPYPCQERPCGCVSADECWAGDCCCFTLEEKLAWAEANGIEPPAHVRPAVEARKVRRAVVKKACCCSDKKSAAKSADDSSQSCCEHLAPDLSASRATSCEDKNAAARSTADNNNSTDCPKSKSADDHSKIRWVVGIYSEKCRSKGPLGQSGQQPSLKPSIKPVHIPEPGPVAFVVWPLQHSPIASTSPPIPPPRTF